VLTTSVALPDCPSLVAMIVAEPGAIAVTTPEDDTVASCGAALLHVIDLPERTTPAASRRTADAWVDWPTFNACAASETDTVATGACGGAATATAALADLPSTVAVIVVLPCETPVTRPVLDTVATVGFAEDHVGTRDGSTLPAPSNAVAVSCVVPLTCRFDEVGVTDTEAAVTAVAVKLDWPAMPSVVAVIVAVPAETAVTRPDAVTVATAGALEGNGLSAWTDDYSDILGAFMSRMRGRE